MQLNNAGKMLMNTWHEINAMTDHASFNDIVVMPNHIHGIIQLYHIGGRQLYDIGQTRFYDSGRTQRPAPTTITSVSGLSGLLCQFKIITTNRYIEGVQHQHWMPFDKKLWQRSYWDRIIRNDIEHEHIKQYIQDNPKNWHRDKLFTD